jgi:hypothetical protein
LLTVLPVDYTSATASPPSAERAAYRYAILLRAAHHALPRGQRAALRACDLRLKADAADRLPQEPHRRDEPGRSSGCGRRRARMREAPASGGGAPRVRSNADKRHRNGN